MNVSARLLCALAGLTVAGITQAQWVQTNLVSDGFVPAAQTDPNMVNAWGLDFGPTSPLWVNNGATSTSTVYQNDGTIVPLVVSIPPNGSEPTGIVFNGGTGFMVSNGTTAAQARFIFVTTNGVISGWAPTVDATNAVPVIDHSSAGAIYTGVTIGMRRNRAYLYATNFRTGAIDVFDDQWNYVTSFTDPTMNRYYSPFNVKAYGDYVIVTWAKHDAASEDEVQGAGLGFVEVFTTSGKLVSRLVKKGFLNAPWGIALEIDTRGNPTSKLWIGNLGDGKINRYNFFTGEYLGPVRGMNGKAVKIDGLWAIAFRLVEDPHTHAMVKTLFFTAGPEDETHGLLGKLTPAPPAG